MNLCGKCHYWCSLDCRLGECGAVSVLATPRAACASRVKCANGDVAGTGARSRELDSTVPTRVRIQPLPRHIEIGTVSTQFAASVANRIRLHPWALFITKHIYHFDDTDCIQRDIRNTSGSLPKFIWSIIYTFPKFDENPPITVWVILLTYRQTNTGQSITSPTTRGECNELMSVRVNIELK